MAKPSDKDLKVAYENSNAKNNMLVRESSDNKMLSDLN